MWYQIRSFGTIVYMNSLNKEESDRLLAILESHVRLSDLSQRELERRLGLSQGYLGALFQGRIQLKVSHVYGIARVLEKDPLYFFMRANPPRNPEWLIEQLGAAKNLFPAFPGSGEPPTREEMLEIIRKTIRSELERLFGALKLEQEEEPDPIQG